MNSVSPLNHAAPSLPRPRWRLLAVLLLCAARLTAATYYVDYATGSDLHAGTATTTPWQHCPGDPTATGVAAGTVLNPGDTVIFKGGVTYHLAGAGGISLPWNGAAGSPITYDGNSAGTWGVGRARFTNQHGAELTAFLAANPAAYLVFRNLEIGAIGGSATLPADPGSAVPPRFGGGLAFLGGLSQATIENCTFSALGYAFAAKPMGASSLAGTALRIPSGSSVTIANCDFSRLTTAIDFQGTGSLTAITVANSSFHDGVVWSLDLPAARLGGVEVYGCIETANTAFDPANWSGYGPSPRTLSRALPAGSGIAFTATASASPAPTYQWLRNGQPVAGATAATFSLAAVTAADAATFSVQATNSLGTTLSHDFVLTVTGTAPPAPGDAIAPVITTQPLSQVAAPFGKATFSVTATGTPTPTFTWYRDGTTFNGWTGTTLVLDGVSTNDVGTYTVVVANSAGRVTSAPATLTLATPEAPPPSTPPPAPADVPPVFTTQPVSQSAAVNSTVTLSVAASGSPAPTFTWYRNDVTFSGWTGATLTIAGFSANDVGTYKAVATNSAGSATSAPAVLGVATEPTPPPSTPPAAVAPVITLQPLSQTVANRSTATFTVAASGTPAPTFTWYRNGTTFTGWTGATLTLPDVTANDTGTYTVVAANSAGSVVSRGAVLSVVPKSKISGAAAVTAGTFDAAAPSRLVNLSVRAAAGDGAAALIVGFVVRGEGEKRLLLRGSGPTLGRFGLTGTLADPVLALHSGTTLLAQNDDWSGGSDLRLASAAAGAFSFAATSTDAALISSVDAGIYSGRVTGKAAASGLALLELYDLAPESPARLVNLSVLTTLSASAQAPVVGFVVAGTAPKRLLVRAVGPSLSALGLAPAVADPKLEVFRDSTPVDANDDWSGAPELAASFVQAGAFPLIDATGRDAALVVTAQPGAYSIVVSGKDRATGQVLIEIYELP